MTEAGPANREAARALVEWYAEMGIEFAVEEQAIDRFAERRPAPPAAVQQAAALLNPAQPKAAVAPSPAPSAGPPGTEQSVMAARAEARSAETLTDLRAALAKFDGCGLKATASNLVFEDGNPRGRVMFVGQAPGREEDIAGRPFVGRSGHLLDRMLKAIGLGREDAYIANIVPWRPPGNRTPTPIESAVCRPFLDRQIELADPEILVLLGGAAAKELLNIGEGIMKMRGRWMTYHTGNRAIRTLITLHPAYLLRQPLQKRHAWRDFLALRKSLDEGQV